MLAMYIDNKLDVEDRAFVENHFLMCSSCYTKYLEMKEIINNLHFEYEKLLKEFEKIESDKIFNIRDYEVFYHNSIKEFLEQMLPKKESGKPLAPCEVKYIKEALDSDDTERIILACLRIITGQQYTCSGIYGSCQGDYATAYYPDTKWYHKYINWVEAWYFGTGTEIQVNENTDEEVKEPEDIEGWTFYTASWRTSDLIREVREQFGYAPDDKQVKVVLWCWDGYEQRPKYKLAEAD